ncbi:MAG TPA: peptidyl-prolyl cis-trans isomerase [Bryobacteraceae bacterium]|nr:peptidyl-prolyl cis-trans isomerase [Bryobacteraceae bacterium]
MFDLFRSRQKAVRILLVVLLGMVALSMLVYLIPGAGMSTGSKDDQVLAEIGNQVLTVREVDIEMRNLMKGREFPPELAQVVIPQKIEQMTAEYASAYEAQRLGFQVTDRDLADAIRSINPQIATLTPQQYRDYIEQQMGETVQEFEGKLRLGLYGTALESLALQGVLATPAEVEAEYRKRNDKIKMEYIAFDTQKLSTTVKPTPAELRGYFDRNKGFFTAPESRGVEVLIADSTKMPQTVHVPESEIQSYYNAHRDEYRTPERVKARHILVMTQGKPAADLPKLRAKAEDLLKQVKGGADFAALAQKNSDDPGSAKNGGDLGWVVRGQMVPEFEKATFELKPKEISGIVTTNYGFHIIQVLEKEQARLHPIDEVRAAITAGLTNQAMSEQMQSLAEKARTELMKAPQNGAQIAKKYNLIFVENPKFTAASVIPELGDDKTVSGVVASLQKGAVSEVTQSGTKLAIVAVTAINPPHPAEYADVEGQIKTMYPQQRAVEIAAEKSAKAAELAKANGGDLKAAAKAVGLEVKTTDFFSRNGAIEGVGAAAAFGDAFDKPIGTVVGPLKAGGDTVLAKVIEKAPADMSKLAAERDTIVAQIKGKKAQERQALMRDSIMAGLMQQGKVKIHKAVVDRMIARYRRS